MIHAILRFLFSNWEYNAHIRSEWISINNMALRRQSELPPHERKQEALYEIPNWTFMDALARNVLFFVFFLRFRDLAWWRCRRLAADKESIGTATSMWQAFSAGYRSYRDYDFHQWLKKRDAGRWLALPPGNPPLALPEGSETLLERKIDEIQKKAQHGCGLYYEIYEPRVLRALRGLKNRLNGYDLEIFNRILSKFNLDISDEAYAASCKAEAEVWAEIRSNCE